MAAIEQIVTRETSRDVQVLNLFEKTSNMQVLTNVARVCKLNANLPGENIFGSKEVDKTFTQASFHLVYDAADKDAKPFMVAHVHLSSGSEPEDQVKRDIEMAKINTRIKQLRQEIFDKTGVWVNLCVAMGDINVNLVKPSTDKQHGEVIEEEFTHTAAVLGNGACVRDGALSKHLMNKMRGEDGFFYNFHNNTQQPKDKAKIENDSKCASFLFDFDPAITEETKKSELARVIQKINQVFLQYIIKLFDFLTDMTNFRDHVETQDLKIGRISIDQDSYLPTAGVKGIKDPALAFKPEVIKDNPNFEADVAEKQRASVIAFYREIYKALSVLATKKFGKDTPAVFDEEAVKTLLSTNEGNKKFLKKLDTSLRSLLSKVEKGGVQYLPVAEADVTAAFQAALDNWNASADFKAVLGLLQDGDNLSKEHITQAKVLANMKTMRDGKIGGDALMRFMKHFNDPDNPKVPPCNFFEKYVQFAGQAMMMEMTGGYAKINGLAYPGTKLVDDAHIKTTVAKVAISDADHVYYTCDAESGADADHPEKPKCGNKTDYFMQTLDKSAHELILQAWVKKLDNYEAERAERYALKDALFSSDQAMRSQLIVDLKQQLTDYVAIPLADQCAKVIAGHALISSLSQATKRLSGHTMVTCLNQIAFQVQKQLDIMTGTQHKQLIEQKDLTASFFVSEFSVIEAEKTRLSVLLTTLKANDATKAYADWALNCYGKIATLAAHAGTLPDDKKGPCERLCQDLSKSMNAFVQVYEANANVIPNESFVKEFQTTFSVIAHSQDELMSEHRSWAGLIADIVTAVLTLGLIHASKALICKVFTGTADFGIFHHSTKRQQLLEATDECVSELKAPTPAQP